MPIPENHEKHVYNVRNLHVISSIFGFKLLLQIYIKSFKSFNHGDMQMFVTAGM